MKRDTTSTAISTHALKAEALASMSASFERFCLAAGLETLSGIRNYGGITELRRHVHKSLFVDS